MTDNTRKGSQTEQKSCESCPERANKGSYQSRHSEVPGMHLLGEPVYFPPCVDEDDSLCDGQGFIQVTQCVQLPLLKNTIRSDTVSSSKLCFCAQQVLKDLGTLHSCNFSQVNSKQHQTISSWDAFNVECLDCNFLNKIEVFLYLFLHIDVELADALKG